MWDSPWRRRCRSRPSERRPEGRGLLIRRRIKPMYSRGEVSGSGAGDIDSVVATLCSLSPDMFHNVCPGKQLCSLGPRPGTARGETPHRPRPTRLRPRHTSSQLSRHCASVSMVDNITEGCTYRGTTSTYQARHSRERGKNI